MKRVHVITECIPCDLVWVPRFHGPWPGSPCTRCGRAVKERTGQRVNIRKERKAAAVDFFRALHELSQWVDVDTTSNIPDLFRVEGKAVEHVARARDLLQTILGNAEYLAKTDHDQGGEEIYQPFAEFIMAKMGRELRRFSCPKCDATVVTTDPGLRLCPSCNGDASPHCGGAVAKLTERQARKDSA